MDNTDFQNYLRNELINFSKGNNTESIQLLLWALVNCFDLDENFAETIVCDGENDKGIDAIYVDDNEDTIYIFQSKYRTINNAGMGDSKLREFMGVKEWFKDRKAIQKLISSNINIELKGLLEFYKIDDLIEDYTIQYHYVSNTFRNDDTDEYVKTINDLYIWDIPKLSLSFHLIRDDELVSDVKSINGIKRVIQTSFDSDNEIKSIFFILQAEELLKLKGIEDLTLFSKNVRYGLGNSRVNKEIRKTINTPEENINFLLFHNGISIVCEKFEYENEIVTIENYSVVNGAQSILSFYQEKYNLNSDIQIMIKLTQVKSNNDLIKLISKYNNNQNSISMKDLRSRDKIQKRIQREFEDINNKYRTKYIYISRRGTPISDEYIQIDNGYAAQLISTCYLNKPYNTHLKASFFDSRYKEVFNRNIDASKILRYHDFHVALLNVKENIKNKSIADYGLVQYFLVSIISEIYKDNESTMKDFNDNEYYFVEREKWIELSEKLYEIVMKIFNHEIKQLQSSEDFVFKNYFKNDKSVSDLSEKIIQGFDTQLSIADTNVETLFRNIWSD